MDNREIIHRFKLRQCSQVHPYTCCGTGDCKRSENDEGELVAIDRNGTVVAECPCGKYVQEIPNEIYDENFYDVMDSMNRNIFTMESIDLCDDFYNDRLRRKLQREKENVKTLDTCAKLS